MRLARVAAHGRGAEEQGSHRGGLAFKAHRLVYHSTIGWRVIKTKISSHRLNDALHALARGVEDAARGALALHPEDRESVFNLSRRTVNLRRLKMKDMRDLKDLTIHDVQPIYNVQPISDE